LLVGASIKALLDRVAKNVGFNLTTAKVLGLKASETFLMRADHVIE
jgi:hypothetical protein